MQDKYTSICLRRLFRVLSSVYLVPFTYSRKEFCEKDLHPGENCKMQVKHIFKRVIHRIATSTKWRQRIWLANCPLHSVLHRYPFCSKMVFYVTFLFSHEQIFVVLSEGGLTHVFSQPVILSPSDTHATTTTLRGEMGRRKKTCGLKWKQIQ